MKTLWIIYSVVFGIVVFLYLSKTSITLSPFKITMQTPWIAVGWFLVAFGIMLVLYQTDRKAYERGANDVIEIVHKQFEKLSNESKSSEGIQPKE